MLFQLVCTDRRYARMNCFNIRELQSVLKRRFFADLMSSYEYKTLFGRTIISLRFKLNSNDLVEHDTTLFHGYGLKNEDLNNFTSLGDNVVNNLLMVRSKITNYLDYQLLVNKAHILVFDKVREMILPKFFINFRHNLYIFLEMAFNKNFFTVSR